MVYWCVLLVLVALATQCNATNESAEAYYDENEYYDDGRPEPNGTDGSAKQIYLIRQYLLNDIKFMYYDSNGNVSLTVGAHREPRRNETHCDPSGKYAIIVHGWSETCTDHQWVTDLVSNLTRHRGGCIICMDYRSYSLQDYAQLVLGLPVIVRTLAAKLERMEKRGNFKPENGYMFGFSFGAHVVLRAGKKYGHHRLEEVDVCDPASPYFDNWVDTDFRAAAKNVQCIHTSQMPGTYYTKGCHQNWRMGECGIRQAAAGPPPFGSHGLCPRFYNAAFTHDFPALRLGYACGAGKAAVWWPRGFKMGYAQRRKNWVVGELFAKTYKAYPWNAPSDADYVMEEIVEPMANATIAIDSTNSTDYYDYYYDDE